MWDFDSGFVYKENKSTYYNDLPEPVWSSAWLSRIYFSIYFSTKGRGERKYLNFALFYLLPPGRG